jgi:hypothetical protein
MLNEREQRVLAMIEQGLRADERRFVEAFHAAATRRDPRRYRWPYRAVLAFGILLVVVGLLTASGGLFIQGLLFGAVGVAWSRWRKGRAAAKPRGGDPERPSLRPGQSPPGWWFRTA